MAKTVCEADRLYRVGRLALMRPIFRLLMPALAGLVVSEGIANTPLPGEAPYRRVCFVCHDRGITILPSLGAPRLGDRIAWETRIRLGVDGLYRRLVVARPDGFQMPMADLTEDEIKAAIGFMLDKAR